MEFDETRSRWPQAPRESAPSRRRGAPRSIADDREAALGSGPAAAERFAARTDVLLMGHCAELASVASTPRGRAPDAGIVVVVPALRRGETRGRLDVGGDALVVERDEQEELITAVRSVSLEQISLRRPSTKSLDRPAPSHREREIVSVVARGCTNAQIAERVSAAERTIRTHRTPVFHWLGLTSPRRAAAVFASNDGSRRSPGLRPAK
jgi:DNA-binding NarL/FixJ family response regulator